MFSVATNDMRITADTVEMIKSEALRNLPDDPAEADHDPLYDGIDDSVEWLLTIVFDVRMPTDMRVTSAEMLVEILAPTPLRAKIAEFLDANT
jgi:hypothetical protein